MEKCYFCNNTASFNCFICGKNICNIHKELCNPLDIVLCKNCIKHSDTFIKQVLDIDKKYENDIEEIFNNWLKKSLSI